MIIELSDAQRAVLAPACAREDRCIYHDRQIAVLDRSQWADWLDPTVSAKTILRTLPAGSLDVAQIG